MARFVDKTTIVLLLIALVLGATGVVLFFQLQTDEISTYLDEHATVRVLLAIHDDDGQPVLGSVLFFHPANGRVAFLDIPPNLGTVVPGQDRIDAINTLFDPNAPEMFRDTVSGLIGQEIPFGLIFSLDELSRFIDLIGGIQIFVINDYRETASDDPLLLPSGNVVLDGPKAVSYLLAKNDDETALERVGRNQAYVQALLRAVQANADLLLQREVVPYRQEYINSELDRRATDGLVRVIGEADFDQLIVRQVQGNVRSVDVDGTAKLLLFPHFEGEWLKQSIRQVEESLAAEEGVSDQTSFIEIEVLNGTSISGFARRTSQLFEEYGFEVRRFGNADSSEIEHTLVIDRRGYASYADRVAGVIRAPRIITEVVPDSDVDVTVILGEDFDGTVVRE